MLSTIGSIANFIQTSISNIPVGLSGTNLIAIVDMNRQHVANYTGQDIGSNSISPQFQPPIVNLSKADTIDFIQAQGDADKISLDELSSSDSDITMSSKSWRMLAESQLNAMGRKSRFTRVLC